MDFPTLESRTTPDPSTYKETPVKGNDIVFASDAGYDLTRRRYTRQRLLFSGSYPNLSLADKTTLQTFHANVGESGMFGWYQPLTGTYRQVRFTDAPEFTNQGLTWTMTFSFKEV